MPKAKRKPDRPITDADSDSAGDPASALPTAEMPADQLETIHSRSVQMGSDRLGVVAKMDLVESKAESGDLFTAVEVCPVDYADFVIDDRVFRSLLTSGRSVATLVARLIE